MFTTNHRKKCDEHFPVCTSCSTRGLECEWPNQKNNQRRSSDVQNQNVLNQENHENDHNVLNTSGSELEIAKRNTALIQSPFTALHNDYTEDFPGLLSPDELFMPDLPTAGLGSFIFPSIDGLDDIGITYLQHYKDTYCLMICIGQASLNYFLKTFLQLAHSRESILYALTAFGGFWYELSQPRANLRPPWRYMQRAAKKICDEIGQQLTPQNKEDFFVLFTFYLIFIGIEVCTGDVCHWNDFLKRCAQLITNFGGLSEVCRMFSNTNDIKWLLLDFQAHDLLSSRALMIGSLFPTEEYEQVLPEDLNYGLDPLQGVLGKVYNLFGEMGHARGALQQRNDRIHELLRGAPPRDDEHVDTMRMAYYEDATATYNFFKDKIDACAPSELHMDLLRQDPHDQELQVQLFNLYVIICRIQLGTAIMRMPPAMVHQQHLLAQALQLVDSLLPSRFRVSLPLLLLVCGLMCCTDYDREKMRERFALLHELYHVGNVQRIEETIEEAWMCNPNGTDVMDWAELVEQKGWNLYVG